MFPKSKRPLLQTGRQGRGKVYELLTMSKKELTRLGIMKRLEEKRMRQKEEILSNVVDYEAWAAYAAEALSTGSASLLSSPGQ
jgi:hypothetical protein